MSNVLLRILELTEGNGRIKSRGAISGKREKINKKGHKGIKTRAIYTEVSNVSLYFNKAY